jgi:hypothetical protein
MSNAIVTDAHGKPVERPEVPAQTATIEERIAYMRALAAYNDRVADLANAAFTRRFITRTRSFRVCR